ncbi:MAG: ABC transporter ATP-binding protein [Thermoproteota archaeon]|jgi:peptide/nickel transport system ATP-binding protein
MSQPLLEAKNLTKVFKVGGGFGLFSGKTVTAVDSISFQIPSDTPKITALVGESGSGKSTIARIILGLLKPTSGDVIYKGKSVFKWIRENKLEYYKEVQPIFQDPYGIYNPFYRVNRVLELVVKKFKLATDKENSHKLILKAMEDVGLRPEDILGRYPHQLSGGERQRLMLARILLIKPKLIVADEPVSMIDVSLRAVFLNHLISFRDKYNISSLFITHDLNVASYVSDNILVLCHGKIVEEGPKNEIIEEPLHPYTKLLMDSVPIPDPAKRWAERLDLTSIESFKKLKVENGCIYSARCPYATDECRNKVPPLLEIKPGRKVACFLYS